MTHIIDELRKQIIKELSSMGYSVEPVNDSNNREICFVDVYDSNEDKVSDITISMDEVLDRFTSSFDAKDAFNIALDILHERIGDFKSSKPTPEIESLKNNLYFGLRKHSESSDDICISSPVEGIDKFLYVGIDLGNGNMCVIRNIQVLLKSNNMTVEEAWEIAENNVGNNVVIEKLDKFLFDAVSDASDRTFIVTNEKRFLGASSILAENVFREFSKSVGIFDWVVIPSSIHEVLVMELNNSYDPCKMSNLIQEVNRTMLEPNEVLSDKPFILHVN